MSPGVDLQEFEERVAALRSAGTAKQQRNRIEHGDYFARVTVQALAELSKEDIDSPGCSDGALDRQEQLLACACKAARHVLSLGAFKCPEPQKLCYNVAARCLILRQYSRAAELARHVMSELFSDDGRMRRTPVKKARMPALDRKESPCGCEPLATCELALTVACVWLRALEALVPHNVGTAELKHAVPASLKWLSQWRALSNSAACKENRVVPSQGTHANRLVSQLASALRELRRRGMLAVSVIDEWESEANAMWAKMLPIGRTCKEPMNTLVEEAALMTAVRSLQVSSDIREPTERR
jgi:hypothetical protein